MPHGQLSNESSRSIMPPQISGCSSASDRPRPHSTSVARVGLVAEMAEGHDATTSAGNSCSCYDHRAASRRVAWKTWQADSISRSSLGTVERRHVVHTAQRRAAADRCLPVSVGGRGCLPENRLARASSCRAVVRRLPSQCWRIGCASWWHQPFERTLSDVDCPFTTTYCCPDLLRRAVAGAWWRSSGAPGCGGDGKRLGG